uniref:Bud site selection protein 6 n=1 Tax=Mycena chlorophos TaxID=658473 RepID=A0ABQ0LA82_MYCCL|nr:bud site selection protein 6 [Mycena chlorophos]
MASTRNGNRRDPRLDGERRTSALRSGDVPTAVRNLLESTKQLPDALRRWGYGEASESDVSDVYVAVGTDFNTMVQAFAVHHIDLSDLHSVPNDLRAVLEQCLAEDPTPQVLASFMPDLRAVLVRLLRGLQARQDAWQRAKAAMGSGGSPGGYDYR